MARAFVNFVTLLASKRSRKEEHEILKELHPTVQKIEESVDQVKESTQSSTDLG